MKTSKPTINLDVKTENYECCLELNGKSTKDQIEEIISCYTGEYHEAEQIYKKLKNTSEMALLKEGLKSINIQLELIQEIFEQSLEDLEENIKKCQLH